MKYRSILFVIVYSVPTFYIVCELPFYSGVTTGWQVGKIFIIHLWVKILIRSNCSWGEEKTVVVTQFKFHIMKMVT